MSPIKKTARPAPAGKGSEPRKTRAPKIPKKGESISQEPAPSPRQDSSDRSFLSTLGDGIAPYPLKEGEVYMNTAQKEHFQRILTIWKQELMEEVDRTVHHMQDEAMNFPDPNDRATQESEFSLELRTRDRERKLIRKIDEALLKLETDEYGYCDQCGVEIGIRRLEARPIATQCIDCKTIEEIREKQLSG